RRVLDVEDGPGGDGHVVRPRAADPGGRGEGRRVARRRHRDGGGGNAVDRQVGRLHRGRRDRVVEVDREGRWRGKQRGAVGRGGRGHQERRQGDGVAVDAKDVFAAGRGGRRG